MIDTTTKRHSQVQLDRMKELAKTNPDAYRFALAWLAGGGDANPELRLRVDASIDYVERTYPR